RSDGRARCAAQSAGLHRGASARRLERRAPRRKGRHEPAPFRALFQDRNRRHAGPLYRPVAFGSGATIAGGVAALRRADRACLRVQYAGNAATHVRARAQDSTARLPPPLPFDRGQKPQERSLMRVSFVLFDGFTALDAIGAYEVLSRIPGLEVEFAAIDRGIVAADTRRLGLLAYRTLNEIRSTDVLIVPGGPGVRALES